MFSALSIRRDRLPSLVAALLVCVILVQMWTYVAEPAPAPTGRIAAAQEQPDTSQQLIQIQKFKHQRQQDDQHQQEQTAAHGRDDVVHTNVTSPHGGIAMTSDAEFASRLARVREVCKKIGAKGAVRSVLKMESTPKAIYCFVAKAGCTFWKSVYIRMKEKGGVTKDNLWTIPNLQVHQRAQMSGYSPSRDSPQHFPLRFLVTRDPFSRLVSAYLDKVYLPDFWQSEVKPMLDRGKLRGPNAKHLSTNTSSDFLRADLEKIQKLFGSEPPLTAGLSNTLEDVSCGKYATFQEFVQSGLDRQEPHWMPVTSLCDPCQFSVTHVSHMETFTPDAVALLAKMGVHDVVDDFDRDTQVADQFRQLVDTNYEMTFGQAHRRGFFSKCLTTRELAYRLWQHFRWRGYIHPHIDYVIPEVSEVKDVKEDLMKQLRHSQQLASADRSTVKEAKQQFMADVFRSLPDDLFRRFLNKYKNDIDLFGYGHLRDKYSALHTVK